MTFAIVVATGVTPKDATEAELKKTKGQMNEECE
jgi:hypothetical protein